MEIMARQSSAKIFEFHHDLNDGLFMPMPYKQTKFTGRALHACHRRFVLVILPSSACSNAFTLDRGGLARPGIDPFLGIYPEKGIAKTLAARKAMSHDPGNPRPRSMEI